ncbi:CYTH and CHAD domain-containing protein [Kutzneria sp. CA-103260]|uniref:CYTH and CHAD domain-containing protein n=1 Tax=Kutzneria sp. CA-103260 TaxID=2802641 RepID=UPI001BA8AAD6|nr:CYTH and CHAD domain-containing protein [Kutzneria sp. CA-103260]QUQ64083.1 CYTH and CHAD domain-containing protein [Kutzneria sp. CA-103260]
MGVERESKLGAPPEFQLPDLTGVVDGAVAEPAPQRTLFAHYYDSADLRLARAGVTLRYRTGEDAPVWTVKLPVSLRGSLIVRREFDFAGTPDVLADKAADLVRAYLRTERLVEVAEVDTDRRTVVVDAGSEQVEVVDDLVTGHDRVHGPRKFREIEVESTAGGNGLADAVVAALVAAGCEPRPPAPKLTRVLGQRAQLPPDVVVPALSRDAGLLDLVRHAFAVSVERIVRHDSGVRIGEDAEHVHQFRVGTRRLRADLHTFGSLLDKAWVAGLREELHWLAACAGDVRDRDVLADRLRQDAKLLPAADRDGMAALLSVLADETAAARVELLGALRGHRYLALLDKLVDAVRGPRFTVVEARPARKSAPGLVTHPWRRLAHAVRSAGVDPTDADLHKIRILAKRCRYAAEAVAPVVGRPAQRFAGAVAEIQTVLGDHQDTVVAEHWLRAAAEVTRGGRVVAGELIAVERAERVRLRELWPQAWHTASARELRDWM